MAETLLKIGCRVEVPSKSVKGTVEYIGTTQFAQGKWIGINLDVPKGKNNGTVKDKEYFKCEESHGMFVRQSQLIILDENDSQIADLTEEATTPRSKSASTTKLSSSRLSLASVSSSQSKEDLSGSTSSLTNVKRASFVERTPSSKLPQAKKEPLKKPKTSGLRKSEIKTKSRDDVSQTKTGFVETLRPQFTPGQVILSPGPPSTPTPTAGINIAGGTTNVSLLQQEIENLREQLKDLHEKYETLKIKRLHDKEKLKEYDKTRLQLEHMVEFKNKIMESQGMLQRELQQARKEARDAIEAKNAHAEDMANVAETVELITLDKEMAEEKAESLMLDLQEVTDKLEEVTLDYQILRAELENKQDGTGNEHGSYEYKQLEQQNTRLKEALVKMRDLVAHDKQEYQKQQKDIDQMKSDVAELSKTKQKLSSLNELLEAQVADLQEQVDAALGAEELVETLGNDKLTLQEKLSEMEEVVADLEAIRDLNDQLLEEQRETELKLREDLDLAMNETREAHRDKEAALENLNDREQTILKFRELVSKQQEQLQELQARLEIESNKPVTLPEILDFKKIFSESKAHKTAIDLELRQMDLQQKEQHIQFLTAYMPESFINRGGDRDAILLLLLLPRLLCKSEILLGQMRDKFPPVDKITRAAVVKEHEVMQFAFKCRFTYYLYSLQAVLHQFVYALDTCTPDLLLKAGAKYPEISIQEKCIDSFVELIKSDRLDENVQLDSLEKCINYLQAIHGVIFEQFQLHQSYYIRDVCRAFTFACDTLKTDSLSLTSLVVAKESNQELGSVLLYTSTNAEVLSQQLKNIRRQIPAGEADLKINEENINLLQTTCTVVNKLVKTLNNAVVSTLPVLVQPEYENGVTNSKLKELLQSSCDKHYESDELNGIDTVKQAVTQLVNVVTKFNDLVHKTDYDLISPSTETPVERPVVLRSKTVKKELDEVKVLAKKLEDKEIDIRELKMSIKNKQEELSEMVIRKELIEKKLASINKDHENEINKLKHELEEVKEALKKKEKDFEDTMDHLQADIDALEVERGELKEKLKVYSKKPTSDKPGDNPPYMSLESDPMLIKEIKFLESRVKDERRKRLEIQSQYYMKQLRSLPPLRGPLAEEDKEILKQRDQLYDEGIKLRSEVMVKNVNNIIDLSKVKPGEVYDATRFWQTEYDRKLELKNKVDEYSEKVKNFIVTQTKGGHIKTSLTTFPTPEMTKALKERQAVTFCEITIPAATGSNTQQPRPIPIHCDNNTFKIIQDKIAELLS